MFGQIKMVFSRKMTVDEAIDGFMRWSAAEADRSPSTMTRYRECLPRFAGLVGGSRPVDSLTLDDVSGYCEWEKSERCPATVMNYMGAVRAFLTFHADRGRVTLNPRLVKVPRVKPRHRVCTVAGEVVEMGSLIVGDGLIPRRNRAMLALMADTGMRLSEVTRMMLSDLNPDGVTGRILGAKKGGERAIEWSHETAELMREYLDVRGSVARCEALFVGDSNRQRGGSVTKNVMQKLIRDTRMRPGVSSHSVRRGFGTAGMTVGVPITAVMKLMGHTSVTTTQLYVTTTDQQLTEARRAIWSHNRPVDKAKVSGY
jgi:site-specific recombinase XerD